ncbi:Rieske (2Fe-2S) protein [Rhodococcus sp. MEB064]|uniref:Rieske (2Fe-2S) protein n=1 Tax=Rhodococcus sp. MEB064 TaxID=1587522 RepID=UPI0005B72FFB|nr:Rieske (2Fe-2S) protein [Rhodococcus sp. MEB064]KIQ17571.1 hypothetical protein RU01_10500 [Rhodococcus sp. MEB064]
MSEAHGRGGSQRRGLIPPVFHNDTVQAVGRRLVGIDDLGERRVTEVRTDEHGVIAVGMLPDDTPFAVSNVCRHQFGKLGRGIVTDDGCLQCPWHRAEFDVTDGSMRSGPKGVVFGFPPYSAAVTAVGRIATLSTYAVEVRDGFIWLTG